jgi:hypothetical protein
MMNLKMRHFNLRDYQETISTEAAKMLEWLKICYLSMEVRTGKTLTALVAAEKFAASNVLFVTKKKAMPSVRADADLVGLKVDVINYEMVHKYTGDPDLVILDEAHCLGQYPIPAERTKQLKIICLGKPIIYLSGTPTPESYSQIYHQLWVSSFSPFKEYENFYKWAKQFVNVKKKYLYNREINDYSQADKAKIDDMTKHLFLSYSQSEAGFLQVVQEHTITVRMKPSTYALAEKLRTARVFIGKGGQEIIADTEVKLMQKLHQVYSGTVKDEAGAPICFDDSKASFIKQHFAGQKIAIFYKFIAEGDMLIKTFGSRITLDPEVFNACADKVFISQIQSGREGINLYTADALVMFNIDFSSVSYQQARARMQSKDRSKPAMLYWIFSENGIERKIYDRVIKKQNYTLSYFKKDWIDVLKRNKNRSLLQG